ncbi:MAG: hypothetical protein DRP47_09240 [Candidatus Zixiibacteriota bacterium]|nr:MAG: hypothetical protein DRP47_09240 [candidate division Zixibacteria bacterium]
MLKLNQIVTITPKIQKLLHTIEGQRIAYNLIPIKPEIIQNLRRKSFLFSALYSARIEGNKLTPESYEHNPEDLEKLEIQNLLDVYTWLPNQEHISLNIDFIRLLHKKSMQNLRTDAGHFRTEQSAIFNSAGVAIYLTPPPTEIRPLLTNWLKLINNSPYLPLISAIIAHYQFEKIHPFLDGNGRIGRLILTILLKQAGHNYIDLLGLEKMIENTRSTYYYHLESTKNDLTQFVQYFLTLITNSITNLLTTITTPQSTISHLPPRRQELLATITDHSPCSADFLYRRFLAIPKSTLRYDLQQLQKAGLIHKLGTTRGALYSI